MKNIIHIMKYGTNKIDHYTRPATRIDIYTNEDGEEFVESRACTGSDDISAPVTSARGAESYRQYSAECPACWLNHSHTTDYHDQHATKPAMVDTGNGAPQYTFLPANEQQLCLF